MVPLDRMLLSGEGSPLLLSKNEMSEPVVHGPETVTHGSQWVELRQKFCNSPGQVR